MTEKLSVTKFGLTNDMTGLSIELNSQDMLFYVRDNKGKKVSEGFETLNDALKACRVLGEGAK